MQVFVESSLPWWPQWVFLILCDKITENCHAINSLLQRKMFTEHDLVIIKVSGKICPTIFNVNPNFVSSEATLPHWLTSTPDQCVPNLWCVIKVSKLRLEIPSPLPSHYFTSASCIYLKIISLRKASEWLTKKCVAASHNTCCLPNVWTQQKALFPGRYPLPSLFNHPTGYFVRLQKHFYDSQMEAFKASWKWDI